MMAMFSTVEETVTVELDAGIVEDEFISSPTLVLECFHGFPQQMQAVVEDVLGPRGLFTARGLQPLDLHLSQHANAQIARLQP
jgi:hypothetical protein